MNSERFQRISLSVCALAFIVFVPGAYVRLSESGLGIANAVLVLAIPVATALNAIAAALLLYLLKINYSLNQKAHHTPRVTI